jgi:hypothetical protein
MLTGTKIALAAAVVTIMSSSAPARYIKSNPANNEDVVAAASAQRGPVRQGRNARLNTYAPMQNGQISGGVGADNYQYWHQACCL